MSLNVYMFDFETLFTISKMFPKFEGGNLTLSWDILSKKPVHHIVQLNLLDSKIHSWSTVEEWALEEKHTATLHFCFQDLKNR